MIEYLGQILYKLYPALTKSQWTHNVTLSDTILAYNLIFRPVDRTSNAQHATGQMNNFASTSLKRHDVSTTLVRRCLKVANSLGNTQYTNGSKVQQRRGHMKIIQRHINDAASSVACPLEYRNRTLMSYANNRLCIRCFS